MYVEVRYQTHRAAPKIFKFYMTLVGWKKLGDSLDILRGMREPPHVPPGAVMRRKVAK